MLARYIGVVAWLVLMVSHDPMSGLVIIDCDPECNIAHKSFPYD